MIKIVHLITSLGLGGTEQQLLRILNRIDKNRFENIIVSMQDEGILGKELRALGFKLYTLNVFKGLSAFKGMIKLVNILKTEQPDILQTWLYHADLFGLLASKFSSAGKLVWNVRCAHVGMQYYSLISAWIIRACARFSRYPDAIIVNSERGLATHQQLGYRPRAWRCIPNGFDLEIFHPSDEMKIKIRKDLNVQGEDLLVGLIGRFDRFKDHKTFFRMAGLAAKKISNVKFLLAGLGTDPSNRLLTFESKKQGVFEKTLFLGVRRDIVNIMTALDVLVLTSISEGFPNVLCEAMACGVPCVSTDAGDVRRILGGTDYIVASEDAEALAETLVDLLNLDREEREKLGISGRNRIAENYSLPIIANSYENLYQNLYTGASI